MNTGKRIAGVITVSVLIAILSAGSTAYASGVEAGRARGALSVGSIGISLRRAYAIRASDTFDSNRKVTVIVLTDSPIKEKPFPNKRQLMIKGHQGKMKGVMAEVGADGELNSLMLFNGKTTSQFSGSMPFSLEALSIDEKRVGGKLAAKPGQAKEKLDVVFSALMAETDRCMERFSVDEETWEKLPEGGGEPGRTFMKFDQAFRKGDVNAVKAGFCPALAKDITPDTFKKGLSMRAKNIKIIGGFLKGDKAMLTGEGISPLSEEKTEVSVWMSKTDSGWKVVAQRDR